MKRRKLSIAERVKKAGSVRSPKKAAAARINGRYGGRPRLKRAQ